MSQQPEASNLLRLLNDAVAEVVARPSIHRVIDDLKTQLQHTPEPFVWSTIDLQSLQSPLPDDIRSGWIFVLKKHVSSGCHYHPNSVQRMVMIEGEGTSKVGTVSGEMKQFGEESPLDETWYVIPEGVPHEFFPRDRDMVVVSFHTCESDQLEEINCDSGATRNYET
ncbi:MAG TPA: cupin domain-containing protein [Pyrinomonadaceae bacterium]|nr:cupin domain-containing protein [Pyrinomonadaceae bacterium]